MSRVLVIYGTTHGHTATVAVEIALTLRERGCEVDVFEAAEAPVTPRAYDGVVVAASIHAGRYQRSVRRWLQRHEGELTGIPSAFVSVCLAVLQRSPEVDHELEQALYGFFRATHWQPTMTTIVAGALPYTKYNVLTRWLMKRMVGKAGGDTDTSRDYEYTDWNQVREFAVRFLQAIEPTANRRAAAG